MTVLRDREFPCARCDTVSKGLSASTTHALTHGKPVALAPSPMWLYINQDGEVVAEALDLEAALAIRDDYPDAFMMHHLALKRKARRERNARATSGTDAGER